MAVVENTKIRFNKFWKATCDGYSNIMLRQIRSLRTDLDLPVMTLCFSRSFSVLLCPCCCDRTVPGLPKEILLRCENENVPDIHIWRLWRKQKQFPTEAGLRSNMWRQQRVKYET